jgi:hypothetical protein
MNHTSFAVTVFSVIASILLFGLWSNVYVYAQHSSSPSSPPPPASASDSSTMLSAEQIAAICDPNNPSSKLDPVNTTESRICGIPKTLKPDLSNATSSATNTTEVSSTATTPQQTTTTKPTAGTLATDTSKQHQQIATTNNNINNKTVSRLIDTKVAAMAPVGNPAATHHQLHHYYSYHHYL